MITVELYVLDSLMWDIALGALATYMAISFASFVFEHIPVIGS